MRLLGIMVALVLPVQAMALSCLRPSVERSFEEASAAAEDYVVVAGRVTLDTRKLPKSHSNNQNPPRMTRVKGVLTGRALNKQGFKVPFDRPVSFEVLCFGPWCGSLQNGGEVLAFVRRDARGYALEVSPCGGRVFQTPKPAMLRKVQACFSRGSCAN